MQGKHILTLALSCLGVLPAAAQTVYRCGNSYSQSPCSGGSAVNVDDRREPGQKSQADAATRRDAQTAALLEKDRRQDEAAQARATRARPAYDMAREDYDDARADPGKSGKTPPYFTARAANAPKKKKKDMPAKDAADKRGTAAARP